MRKDLDQVPKELLILLLAHLRSSFQLGELLVLALIQSLEQRTFLSHRWRRRTIFHDELVDSFLIFLGEDALLLLRLTVLVESIVFYVIEAFKYGQILSCKLQTCHVFDTKWIELLAALNHVLRQVILVLMLMQNLLAVLSKCLFMSFGKLPGHFHDQGSNRQLFDGGDAFVALFKHLLVRPLDVLVDDVLPLLVEVVAFDEGLVKVVGKVFGLWQF